MIKVISKLKIKPRLVDLYYLEISGDCRRMFKLVLEESIKRNHFVTIEFVNRNVMKYLLILEMSSNLCC